MLHSVLNINPMASGYDGMRVRSARRWHPGLASGGFPVVNLLLFIATLFTTVFAGAYLSHFDHDFFRFFVQFRYNFREWLLDGLPFAVSLLAILVSHELGHWLLSRYHRVRCSLPYFIPGPNLVGTFGAVIFMKSAIPDRRALFDIGAAGPLTGLLVASFTMLVGFATAKVEYFYPGAFPQGMVVFQPNLLLWAAGSLWPLATPEIPAAMQAAGIDPDSLVKIMSSPFLDAACVGYLVTMLNLMPIGQLDGGHISYALFGSRSWLIGIIMFGVIVVLGIKFWFAWLFLAGLLLLLMGRRGFRHPPPVNPQVRLNPGRKVLGAVVLISFALIISPAPVNVYLPGEEESASAGPEPTPFAGRLLQGSGPGFLPLRCCGRCAVGLEKDDQKSGGTSGARVKQRQRGSHDDLYRAS